MMTVSECIKYVEDHMEVRYATKNGAYQSGRKISPEGSVNHSVGCAQPSVDVFFNLMNSSSAGWGVNALIGDFHKGEGRIILCMDLTTRPWGCASGRNGSWNNTKIQWEICEPAGHTYAGGTMIGYDVAKNQGYFDRMWKMVVAWNVYCCVKFGYPVSGINDHAESYKAGYGSNHSDISQWIPKHGKTMDDLRAEVEAIINGDSVQEEFVSYQGIITANGGLNCRTSPVNGSIISTYPANTVVTIIKEKGGWGYTGIGWVSLDYIDKISVENTELEDDFMADVKKFEEMWLEYRKSLQDNDSSQWSNEAREWAVNTGIVQGGSTSEFNGMWQDVLTREQMVTIMYRFAKLMGQA